MAALAAPAAEVPPITIDEHGVARVGETRVTLDLVVYAFKDGLTPEEIVQAFTTVRLRDVHAVIAYYLGHTPEVDSYLKDREREALEVRQRIEAICPPEPLRERLLARKAQKDH